MATREELRQQLDEAQETGDVALAAQLQDELNVLDITANIAELEKKRNAAPRGSQERKDLTDEIASQREERGELQKKIAAPGSYQPIIPSGIRARARQGAARSALAEAGYKRPDFPEVPEVDYHYEELKREYLAFINRDIDPQQRGGPSVLRKELNPDEETLLRQQAANLKDTGDVTRVTTPIDPLTGEPAFSPVGAGLAVSNPDVEAFFAQLGKEKTLGLAETASSKEAQAADKKQPPTTTAAAPEEPGVMQAPDVAFGEYDEELGNMPSLAEWDRLPRIQEMWKQATAEYLSSNFRRQSIDTVTPAQIQEFKNQVMSVLKSTEIGAWPLAPEHLEAHVKARYIGPANTAADDPLRGLIVDTFKNNDDSAKAALLTGYNLATVFESPRYQLAPKEGDDGPPSRRAIRTELLASLGANTVDDLAEALKDIEGIDKAYVAKWVQDKITDISNYITESAWAVFDAEGILDWNVSYEVFDEVLAEIKQDGIKIIIEDKKAETPETRQSILEDWIDDVADELNLEPYEVVLLSGALGDFENEWGKIGGGVEFKTFLYDTKNRGMVERIIKDNRSMLDGTNDKKGREALFQREARRLGYFPEGATDETIRYVNEMFEELEKDFIDKRITDPTASFKDIMGIKIATMDKPISEEERKRRERSQFGATPPGFSLREGMSAAGLREAVDRLEDRVGPTDALGAMNFAQGIRNDQEDLANMKADYEANFGGLSADEFPEEAAAAQADIDALQVSIDKKIEMGKQGVMDRDVAVIMRDNPSVSRAFASGNVDSLTEIARALGYSEELVQHLVRGQKTQGLPDTGYVSYVDTEGAPLDTGEMFIPQDPGAVSYGGEGQLTKEEWKEKFFPGKTEGVDFFMPEGQETYIAPPEDESFSALAAAQDAEEAAAKKAEAQRIADEEQQRLIALASAPTGRSRVVR